MTMDMNTSMDMAMDIDKEMDTDIGVNMDHGTWNMEHGNILCSLPTFIFATMSMTTSVTTSGFMSGSRQCPCSGVNFAMLIPPENVQRLFLCCQRIIFNV